MLTVGPQSLVDVAFAALLDLGLNQLARVQAGYGTGPGGLTAPRLVQLLSQDLDADGPLYGIGVNAQFRVILTFHAGQAWHVQIVDHH
jgi:hypothetical protein